jgi:CRP/FNR family transcriptional regulator, cyclic AMP receptor protein
MTKTRAKKTRKTVGSRKAVKAKARARARPAFDFKSIAPSIGPRQTTIKVPAKGVVFRQGEPADAVFYLQKGKVKIAVLSKQGKEAVVAIHQAGEFFGEACLADQPLHLASAVAIEDAIIIRIGKETMIRLLEEQPAFAEKFMAFLLTRNIQVEADLVDQLFNSSEKRLARTLLMLANVGKEGTMEKVVPKISQDVLAARVGTTRSRINFFMNKFRKLGFIEYNGDLKVHSSLVNMVVHD